MPKGVYERTIKCRKALSKAHRGLKFSKVHCRNIGDGVRGKTRVKKILYSCKECGIKFKDYYQNDKSFCSRRCQYIFMNGIPHTKEHKEKIRKTSLKVSKRGEESHKWKGDNAGYHAFHRYVSIIKPKPKKCQLCSKNKKLELAFKKHPQKYTRNPNDYLWICRKCHVIKDRRRLCVKK